MKGKIKLPIILLIIIAILIFIGYKLYSKCNKLKQEEILINEINKISSLDASTANYNTDIKTKGDYAIVEKTLKNYLNDFSVALQEFTAISQNEELSNILSVSNYTADGPDFVKTKQLIADTQKNLSEKFEKLKNMCTEDYIMEQIKSTGVKEYYINLYKTLILEEDSDKGVLDDAKSKIEETNSLITSLLTASNNIITFLSENKNSWEISGNQIIFSTQENLDTYNSLASQLSK